MKRFTRNNFFVEKNPTIVNFPVKNLELKDIIPLPEGVVPTIPLQFLMFLANQQQPEWLV